MANTIKHKRGSGSDPSASDLVAGELAIRTDTGVVFTKKDDGTVAQIAGGGDTDLGVSTTTTAVTVTSSTGNNATISEASSSAAGVMSAAHHDKLDGIASGATANSTESIQDIVGGMVSGNSESGISVTYQDSDGTLDFSVTSQTDNNFTTTLKNKLDGIESGATADQSASEILTAIKTVDGASSGLDADLLDGQHGSYYLNYNNFSNTPTIPTNNNQLTNGAGYITSTLTNEQVQDIVGAMVSGNTESGISVVYQDGDGTLDFTVSGTNLSKTTTTTSNTILSSTGNNVTLNEATGSAAGLMSTTHHNKLDGIESGATADQTASEILTLLKTVDGAGSGLDADSLDGLTQGDFIRANADDNVTAHTEWQDAKEVRLGNGADMKLYHNAGANYIDCSQDLLIRHGTETMIRANDDGDVELYYNNSKKLETKSDGVDIVGELQCDTLDVDGNGDIAGRLTVNGLTVDDDGTGGPVLQLRTDDQSPWALQISNDTWSNGSNRGLLFFQGNDGTFYQRLQGVSNNWEALYIQQSNGSTTNTGIQLTLSREVKLYYQNSNKLTTKSDGVDITGELQCDSLDVDGSANITGNIDINENIRHNGDTNTYFGFPTNDAFRVVTAGAERFRITNTGAIAIEGSSNYGSSGQVLTSNGNDAPTWQDGGGTVASGCVYENSQTISSNYSVTSGKNAMSAGPITIASGVTVTVTSGSTYTIV